MLLEGVRVVDWGVGQVGPYAAMLLGDLGADVIKVEPLNTGDFMRRLDNFLNCSLRLPNGRMTAFEAFNRNKKSIAVDLTKPEGRQIVHDLVEKSDVFVTNYRASAADHLSLDYASLRQRNSKLIYASSSCFGPAGAEAGKRGDDPTAQARIGMMYSCAEPSEEPHYVSPGCGDAMASILLASAIQGALYAREKFGVGQEVTVSQVSALMALLRFQVSMALFHGYTNAQMKMPRLARGTANSGFFRCKDEKWIFLSAAWTGEKGWQDMCRLIGQPELIEDPRFTDIPRRLANSVEVNTILERAFATRTAHEWDKTFAEFEGVFCRIRDDLREMANDPQMRANDYVVDVDHPALGPVKTLGVLPHFSETPGSLRESPPELGQHTEEVLMDVVGYDWQRIEALKASQIIL